MPKINGDRPPDRDLDTLLNVPEGLYTGDIDVTNWGHDRGQLEVEHDLPLPGHIAMIYGWMEMGAE